MTWIDLHPNHSGWALVCELVGHVAAEAADYLPVNLDRYQRCDQSLIEVLGLPPYTVAARAGEDQPWVIETRGLPPEMQN